MKRAIFAGALGALAFVALTGPLQASYYARCDLVVKLDSVAASVEGDGELFQRMANFTIVQILDQRGHNNRHCEEFGGRSEAAALLSPDRDALSALTAGANVRLRYSYMSRMTPGGMRQATAWRLIPPGVLPGANFD
jgi:hypothetical protein